MGYKNLIFPKGSLFLVTGAAGFIGSNLCEAILDMGYRVRALDDLSTGKKANIDMFSDNPNYEFIKADIKHSNADIGKAKKMLGYAPEWSSERGIEAAIQWYKENL